MLNSLLRNIELWLSAAGLGVIVAVPLVVATEGADPWRVTSITAIAVGVIHGLLFWLVRRRQREVRESTIADIRGMLRHLINNPLCTISLKTGLLEVADSDQREILMSVERITHALDELSHEGLTKWRDEGAWGQP